MGFKRTTQQLSLVTAGVTLDTIGKEQMMALIDWIGVHPGGGIPTKEIFNRVIEAADALHFEVDPNDVKLKRSGIFIWHLSFRAAALGLMDLEEQPTEDFRPDAYGSHLRSLIGPHHASMIEWAPDDILTTFDLKRFTASVEAAIKKAGGKLTPSTHESGWPAMEARFKLPDGKTIVYDLLFIDEHLSIYLISPRRHSRDYRVPHVVTEDDVEKLADQMTALFCQRMSTFTDAKDMPRSTRTGFQTLNYDKRVARVYIIESDDYRTKIGISMNVRTRVMGLATTGGFKVLLAHCTPPILNARGIEAQFKNHFADRRCNGEWFDVTGEEAMTFVEDAYWLRDNKRLAKIYKHDEDKAVARMTGSIDRMVQAFKDAHAAHQAQIG